MPDLPDLSLILRRALRRSAVAAQARRKLKGESEAERIARDYARRLAEKALYRQLLSDERMDGLRFRWYFSHVKRDTPLDELRIWIDHKIVEEKDRADS